MAALETQLRALADRMRHSEQDAAAARVLAGGADRDVTDLGVKVDANRKAINALGEQTAARFDRLEQRVDNRFAEIRGKLDAAAVIASLHTVGSCVGSKAVVAAEGEVSQQFTPDLAPYDTGKPAPTP